MGNHSIFPFAERFTARALPVFLLVSGLFASGCGGDGDSSVSPTSVPTPAPAPTPTPAPPAEMAPRSQSEFDNRVIGKQFTQGSFSLTFLAPGRLREIDQGTAYDGDYRYDYAGANSGMLTYTYDVTGNDPNRERSEVRFVFGSELSGTFEYSYFENGSRRETASGNFELVPAPSVPPPTIGAGSGAALFGAGDRISGFPAGSAGIPRVTSGASVSLSGGRLTITMSRGGYVEYDDYRYTCNASQCRIEDGLVTSGTIERTVAGSAAGGSGGGGSGGGGTGGGTSGNTFGAGDRISGFPAGSAGIPRVTSGASVSLSGGRLTITMSRGGYVEYDDYRYTCNASQCRIEDGLVTSGTIERTVAGSAAGGSGGGGSGGGTGGGSSSGNPLVLVGELDCSIETAFPGTLRGTVEGRLRGVRPVSFVIVTGSLIERDGAQRTHELIPDLLGSFEVGETKSFSSSNLFSSDATRFGCEAQLEWTEIGQHRTRSLRVATPIAPVRPSSE